VRNGRAGRTRRLTVYFALISLVAHLANEMRNSLLSVESNGDGLVMVAEQTCERGVWPIKSARPVTRCENVPSGSLRLAALAAAGFLDDFLRFPICRLEATAWD